MGKTRRLTPAGSGHLSIFRITTVSSETEGHGKRKRPGPQRRRPRENSPNLKDGFVVVAVRERPNVVDLDLPHGPLRIKNIPWTMLTYLDEEPHS